MTEAWTKTEGSGYVDDVVYTLGFYGELAPSFLDYVCLINGVEGLPAGRRLRYCELGCGRGYGTSLLAASNPDISVVGIDFNRSHIAEARAFAEQTGIANVKFFELEFSEAARSGDPQLGAFDIVALHGVYAWVGPPVREAIHNFLRAKLVSGGIAFVSYNALPGATRLVATQRMLLEAGHRAAGDSLARLAKGIELLRQVVEKSGGTTEKNKAVPRKQLASLERQDRHYLAHEYLNEAWRPLFVTETIGALAEADLSYVGSANIAENRIELCVPKDLRQTVREAPDVGMREMLKDYVVNKPFRRDVYVKAPRSLNTDWQRQRLMELTFAPMRPAQKLPDKLQVPIGALAPRRDLLAAIWPRLQAPTTGAEIMSAASTAGASEQFVWPLMEILVHNRFVHPARRDAARVDQSAARRLNETVVDMSCSTDTHKYLASPVLGSAIHASHPDRVIASVLRQDPELDDLGVAERALDRVKSTGRHFLREDRWADKSDKNVRGLAGFVREFRERRLPRWRALGVVE